MRFNSNIPRRTLIKLGIGSALFQAAASMGLTNLKGQTSPGGTASKMTIVVSKDAPPRELLGAQELFRYGYLRTGVLAQIKNEVGEAKTGEQQIVIGSKDDPLVLAVVKGSEVEQRITRLEPQQFLIAPVVGQNTVIVGGDDVGTLYGAYRYAEHLGVGFQLEGDVLPDELLLAWPTGIVDEGKPIFDLRGIQPFHDFAEGPDWWNADDYKAVVAQLVKMRMNFIGLHTYPEKHPSAEPTVWVGLEKDTDQRGRVKFSYPSQYQNTIGGTWGYSPTKTSDYVYGAAHLFERDDYGPDVMIGLCPRPQAPPQCNELFNRTGDMLKDAFTFARKLGVKTCAGTETPLTIPEAVKGRLKEEGRDPASPEAVKDVYKGIFRRAASAYPLDYYWIWTPERAIDADATQRDLVLAMAAFREVRPEFGMALCGWGGMARLFPRFDKVFSKEVAFSCINDAVGYGPVSENLRSVVGRGKWAIPWLEDDPRLTVPQFWVGRTRKSAADAKKFGCNGLMGLHWRTRPVGPNFGALAQAGWSQEGWQDYASVKYRQGVRISSSSPSKPAPNRPAGGSYPTPATASLGTRLAPYSPSGDFYRGWAKTNFGESAFQEIALIFERLDGVIPLNTPTPVFWGPGVLFGDPRPWEEAANDYSCADDLAALRGKIQGKGNLARFDYWLETFRYQKELGRAACILGQYEEGLKKVFALCGVPLFVPALPPTTPYVRSPNDFAASLHRLFYSADKMTDEARQVLEDEVLPARKNLIDQMKKVHDHLFAIVSSTGELGTVANWQQENIPILLTTSAPLLEKLLGKPLPPGQTLPKDYDGPLRLIVPTVRSVLGLDEVFNLKVLVLSAQPPDSVTLCSRPLGDGPFQQMPIPHVNRGVYSISISPQTIEGNFEYYVQVVSKSGINYFPATAPGQGQTVVRVAL